MDVRIDVLVRIRQDPSSMFYVIFHGSVFCRAMAGLAHKPQQESWTLIAGNREADGIVIAIARQA